MNIRISKRHYIFFSRLCKGKSNLIQLSLFKVKQCNDDHTFSIILKLTC